MRTGLPEAAAKSCNRNAQAGSLYNTMIAPFTVGPMALTGATWCTPASRLSWCSAHADSGRCSGCADQGESNSQTRNGNANKYRCKMEALVSDVFDEQELGGHLIKPLTPGEVNAAVDAVLDSVDPRRPSHRPVSFY